MTEPLNGPKHLIFKKHDQSNMALALSLNQTEAFYLAVGGLMQDRPTLLGRQALNAVLGFIANMISGKGLREGHTAPDYMVRVSEVFSIHDSELLVPATDEQLHSWSFIMKQVPARSAGNLTRQQMRKEAREANKRG